MWITLALKIASACVSGHVSDVASSCRGAATVVAPCSRAQSMMLEKSASPTSLGCQRSGASAAAK
jgi:hypothetical protein